MRSLRSLSLLFESIGTLVILGFVLLMLSTLQQTIRTETLKGHTAELEKIEYVIGLYLSERESEFNLLNRGDALQGLGFLKAFSDIYYTNGSGVITEVIKQEPGSRIFKGFDLSTGPVGSFLFALEGQGASLSPMLRSAERDTISVYVAAHTASGYLVGRIGLDGLMADLGDYARNLDSILIIASHEGYIITSTEKVLPIQVVPPGDEQEITVGERYLMTRSHSGVLGNDLVLLTPMNRVLVLLESIRTIYPLFLLSILAIMLIKIYLQDRYLTAPLRRFLEMLKNWEVSEQLLTTGAAVIHTRELQALYHTFVEKSEAISQAFEVRRLAQEAMTASQEKYRALFESAGDAILILAEDKVLDCNGRALILFGMERTSLIGRSIRELSPEYQADGHLTDLEVAERIRRAHGGQSQVFQWIHTRGNGTFIYTEVSLSPLNLETGVLVQAIIRDITLRKEAEAALQRMNDDLERRVEARTAELKDAMGQLMMAEKLASLGTLVGGVAHEINTPVGICVTTATFLNELNRRQQSLLEAKQLTRHEYVEFMKDMDEGMTILVNNLHRASELINGFKQIAVDQINEQRAGFPMLELLNNLILSMKHEYKKRGHRFEVICSDRLTLDSYPGIYTQILTNLIMNSILHGFGETEGGLIRITVTTEDDYLKIVYEDDGKGIAAENLPRIFDPFYTTGRHFGSSGLGLHIVFNLVTQKLKGRILCDSTVGKGTRFTLVLPDRGNLGEALLGHS